MALSTAEKVTVAEITREAYGAINDRASSLNAEQITSIQDDIDIWEGIRNSHVRILGDGVDFDNERKREAIRQRIRKALGLPLFSDELGSGGSTSIPTVAVF